ncbi:NAD-binding protein [Streptomyces sp. ISL-11]|uniref:CASTOR/POLLUX-related putative ion channel n=1 Tax=Streptomyces sp. ISL-11 TaxID=2819174 RepID=UPI001BE633D6|nr:NAD-binding protein [Streptomyces sp. ISL-11]MBT2385532.1 NAD-binding protein [Streptomyces sp. ISL-11]
MAGGTSALIGWLALACLAVVVPASALLVWTDRRAPASLQGKVAAVWRNIGQTLRLGGDVGPPLSIALSLLLALVALLYVSALVGLLTAGITEKLTALRRGHSTVLEHGHTVVLGWSEQTPTVVAELVAAQANQRRGTVVVLADRDKTEMEEELHGTVGETGRTRVICRSGRPTDPAALARVSPSSADAVLVLPRDDASDDAEIVKTLLSLRATVGEDCPVRVVAVVRDDRYRVAAQLAAGSGATVLEIDDVSARLLVQCSRHPGLSLVHQDLLDFAGDEFYTVDEPALVGRRFDETLAAYPVSCTVGIVRAGGDLVLNPPSATEFLAGDRLVVIAEDDDITVLPDEPPPVDPSVIVPRPAREARPERVLLLGWNRRARRIVDQLSRSAARGSVLDVVADDRAATATAVRAAGAASGDTLSVVFHPGDPTLRETIERLDVAAYDGVIVLGPDRRTGHGEPDDRTLVTLLLLRALERESGHRVPVVTEMADDRNRAIAPVSPGADFVVSGKLVGLLMAQISQNEDLAALFEELFSPGGNTVCLRPAGHYVEPGRAASFATVVESARRQGACAIGYRSHTDAGVGPGYGVRVNPPKTEVRRWSDGDEVIVIAAD